MVNMLGVKPEFTTFGGKRTCLLIQRSEFKSRSEDSFSLLNCVKNEKTRKRQGIEHCFKIKAEFTNKPTVSLVLPILKMVGWWS